ncbi:hypothetical protein ACFE04_017239 [Oxalis oulophora]
MDGSMSPFEVKNGEEAAVWDCGSPLYDSYELVSLNYIIERHLMALPTSNILGGSKRVMVMMINKLSRGSTSHESSSTNYTTTPNAPPHHCTINDMDNRKRGGNKMKKMKSGISRLICSCININ